MWDYWWLIPVSYFVGNFSWGMLIVRVVKGKDPRNYGSGKTGMTNVLRIAGKKSAAAVLVGDAGKGAVVIGLAMVLTDNEVLHAACGVSSVLGHIWPVLAGFRGGRGIATGMGASVALEPWMLLLSFGAFLPVVYLTRFVSLASIAGTLAVVISFGIMVIYGSQPLPYFVYALVSGSLIILMHRDNIQRLVRGNERRIGDTGQ
jgi:glycerol-3-phosphate acyltransferase PlsY